MYSDFDFEKVYLMLGEACDFKCRHCLQQPFHNHLEKTASEKLIKYLQHLADLKPRFTPTGPKRLSIIFFGGEPLLYMKAIKDVVARINRENVDFSLVSNGNALTQEMVDFFNEHDIHFAVSNDGPLTDKVRDRNVFEDEKFLALFKQLNSKSVCATLHAHNQDLYALWGYVNEKVGDVPLAYEFLTHTWQMPEDIYDYDLVAWKGTMDSVVNNLMHHLSTETTKCREAEFMSKLMGCLEQFQRGKARFPRCRAYRQNINLDLEGNHYLCHNGMEKFSDCSKEGAKVAKEAEVKFIDLRNKHNKACADCSALPVCQEGCPFSPSSEGQDIQCEFTRIMAEAVYKFVRLSEAFYQTEIDFE